jgi:hypothetical protein
MADPVADIDVDQLPEELPPVEPPSAGFIIQLFVVPGLIVAGVVGAWALFGKLATGEQDWRGLVLELQQPNPHRRWRAALGLAQLLKADQDRGASRERLAANVVLARRLVDALTAALKVGGHSQQDREYQEYLARALGLFDLPESVLPALQAALRADNEHEVRKSALSSIAVMTDRMATAGTAAFDGFIPELLVAATDESALIRRLAAFTLGLFPQEAARERLAVLLDDADGDTRLNAAIGLARSGDVSGERVFRDVLEHKGEGVPGSADEYERFVSLKNCLAAIEKIAGKLNAQQRGELIPLVQPLAEGFREPKIRITAQGALTALKSADD